MFKKTMFAVAVMALAGVAQAGWYGVAGVGMVHVDEELSDVLATAQGVANLPLTGGVGLDNDSEDFGYKLAVGYQFNPNFAIEGGFYGLGEQSSKVTVALDPSEVYHAKVASETTGFVLSAVGYMPLNEQFQVLGKAGFGVMTTEQSLSVEGIPLKHDTTRIVPMMGIGAEYAFTENWAMRAEWEHFFNTTDTSIEDLTYKTSHDLVTVGVKYTF